MVKLSDMATEGFTALHESFLMYDSYNYSMWASVIEWFFGVADVLYHTDADMIPDAWQYRHGCGCNGNAAGNPDSDIQDMVDDGVVTVEDLAAFGNVLDRFADMLRVNGRSY